MHYYQVNKRRNKPVKLGEIEMKPIKSYKVWLRDTLDISTLKVFQARVKAIDPNFVTVNLRTYRVKTRLHLNELHSCIDAVVSCEVIAK